MSRIPVADCMACWGPMLKWSSSQWVPLQYPYKFSLNIYFLFVDWSTSLYMYRPLSCCLHLGHVPGTWSSYQITIRNANIVALKLGTRLFSSSSLGLVTLIPMGDIQDGHTVSVIKVYIIDWSWYCGQINKLELASNQLILIAIHFLRVTTKRNTYSL